MTLYAQTQKLLLIGAFVFLDQYIKYLSRSFVFGNNIFAFSRWKNVNNAVFSFIPFYIGTLISLFFLVALLLLIFSISFSEMKLPFILVFSGGVSNLFDKLFFGAVIDNLYIAGLIFNLADIFILIGFALITYKLFRVNKTHIN